MEQIFSAATIKKRRQRAANVFGDTGAIVLFGSGQLVPKPGGLDQTYRFQPHPDYYWLTGSRRSGGVLAYDAREGFTHFVRPVDAVERLWEGDTESPIGADINLLAKWLAERPDRPVVVLGSPIKEVASSSDLSAEFKERLDSVRRVKDSAEVELLERAAAATATGFERAQQVIQPGVTERAIQIEMEAEFYRHGADDVGYDSIVATGAHAAVLHSQPSGRIVGADDVVLVDAGAAIAGYTADVTRTYAASGRFNAEQQAIYDVVLAAELVGINHCRDGTEWHDVHRTAAATLASGLNEIGILRTGVDESLETGAIALFFPHGIGHMVGLGVRDVGGRVPEREEARMCCGAKVRVDLPIRQGFVMTVEPGLYFVPAILDDPERREKFRDAVDWDGLARWRKVGGVRIEDNVLITGDEPRVLTAAIPK